MRVEAWLLAGCCWIGCATRQPAQTQVRSISFTGNGGLLTARSDRALRQVMGHPQPGGIWPFRSRVALDEAMLEQDRRRLYVYYAHRGFFDGELVRWRIEEVRPASDRDPPVVRVVGEIVEGPHSAVAQVAWDGLDGLPGPVARRIRARASLASGDPFSLLDHEATLDASRQILHDSGFAHATVDGTVRVRRAGDVTLRYAVNPGVRARFGAVRFTGGAQIPEALLREKLAFEEGERYRQSRLDRTQQALYGTGAFAVVEVAPALDATPPDVVPIDIRLQPRAPRSVALGVGLQAQSGRQELLGRASFHHVNALHRLVDLDASVTGGYAALADDLFSDPLDVRGGPVVDARAAVQVPSVPFSRWRAQLEVGYEREVTWAYQLDRPSVTPSIIGSLAEDWTLTLSYWLRYTRYSDLQVNPAELGALVEAPDLVDGSFRSAFLEQTLLWDTRNNPLEPTRGHRHSVTLRQAGRWLGGSYDYLGWLAELRQYWSPRRARGWAAGTVLAGRLGGGLLAPVGPAGARVVPISERLYLGGSDSVRGWVYQHLGPLVCVREAGGSCDLANADLDDPDVDTIPVGGRVASYGSFEVRQSWDLVGLVAFVDAGMVWPTLDRIDVPILPSVGLGGRVYTPVGPFRLDVAVRTDRRPEFAGEPRVWFHLGLGEAF